MSVFKGSLQRWIALMVCVCFTASLFPEAYAAIPSLELSTKSEVPRILNIDIPAEMASVDEWYEAPAKPHPKLIVHIQDAHSNYEAQTHIRDVIQFLNKNYGFKTILVEGAAESLDPKYLKLFPDQERNLKLVDELAKEGEVTGTEMVVMEDEKSVETIGIEKPELYRKNFDALQSVYREDALVKSFLEAYEKKLGQVASRTFSPHMIQALAEWRKFEAGHREFLPFAVNLGKLSKAALNLDLDMLYSQMEWPQLTRLLVLQKVEKELDKPSRPEAGDGRPQAENSTPSVLGSRASGLTLREQALQEKQAVIDLLKSKSVSQGLVLGLEKLDEKNVNLNRMSASEVRQAGTPRILIEKLVEEGGKVGFDIRDYPAFAKYAGYLIVRSEMVPGILFEEINKLFDMILDVLVKEPSSSAQIGGDFENSRRRLLAIYRDEALARKLMALELNRNEWLDVTNRRDRFQAEDLVRRLKEAAGESGRLLGPDSEKKKNLAVTFEQALKFYEAATSREDYFFQKMQEALSKTDKAILITGGFHADGMKSLMRQYDINYGTLTPRITQNFSNEKYRKVMMEGVSADVSTMPAPLELQRSEVRSQLAAPAHWAGRKETIDRIAQSLRTDPTIEEKPALRSEMRKIINYEIADLRGRGFKNISLSLDADFKDALEKLPEGSDITVFGSTALAMLTGSKLLQRFSMKQLITDVDFVIRNGRSDQIVNALADFSPSVKPQIALVQLAQLPRYRVSKLYLRVLKKNESIVIQFDDLKDMQGLNSKPFNSAYYLNDIYPFALRDLATKKIVFTEKKAQTAEVRTFEQKGEMTSKTALRGIRAMSIFGFGTNSKTRAAIIQALKTAPPEDTQRLLWAKLHQLEDRGVQINWEVARSYGLKEARSEMRSGTKTQGRASLGYMAYERGLVYIRQLENELTGIAQLSAGSDISPQSEMIDQRAKKAQERVNQIQRKVLSIATQASSRADSAGDADVKEAMADYGVKLGQMAEFQKKLILQRRYLEYLNAMLVLKKWNTESLNQIKSALEKDNSDVARAIVRLIDSLLVNQKPDEREQEVLGKLKRIEKDFEAAREKAANDYQKLENRLNAAVFLRPAQEDMVAELIRLNDLTYDKPKDDEATEGLAYREYVGESLTMATSYINRKADSEFNHAARNFWKSDRAYVVWKKRLEPLIPKRWLTSKIRRILRWGMGGLVAIAAAVWAFESLSSQVPSAGGAFAPQGQAAMNAPAEVLPVIDEPVVPIFTPQQLAAINEAPDFKISDSRVTKTVPSETPSSVSDTAKQKALEDLKSRSDEVSAQMEAVQKQIDASGQEAEAAKGAAEKSKNSLNEKNQRDSKDLSKQLTPLEEQKPGEAPKPDQELKPAPVEPAPKETVPTAAPAGKPEESKKNTPPKWLAWLPPIQSQNGNGHTILNSQFESTGTARNGPVNDKSWVATVSKEMAKGHYFYTHISDIDPVTGALKGAENPGWLPWKLDSSRPAKGWAQFHVSDKDGQRIPVPIRHVPVSVETEGGVPISFFVNDRGEYMVKGATGMVKVYYAERKPGDPSPAPTKVSITSAQHAQMMKMLPIELQELVVEARKLSQKEREEIVDRIMDLTVYTQNPLLNDEIAKHGFLSALTHVWGGQCILQSSMKVMLRSLVDVPAYEAEGFVAAKENIDQTMTHGFVITPPVVLKLWGPEAAEWATDGAGTGPVWFVGDKSKANNAYYIEEMNRLKVRDAEVRRAIRAMTAEIRARKGQSQAALQAKEHLERLQASKTALEKRQAALQNGTDTPETAAPQAPVYSEEFAVEFQNKARLLEAQARARFQNKDSSVTAELNNFKIRATNQYELMLQLRYYLELFHQVSPNGNLDPLIQHVMAFVEEQRKKEPGQWDMQEPWPGSYDKYDKNYVSGAGYVWIELFNPMALSGYSSGLPQKGKYVYRITDFLRPQDSFQVTLEWPVKRVAGVYQGKYLLELEGRGSDPGDKVVVSNSIPGKVLHQSNSNKAVYVKNFNFVPSVGPAAQWLGFERKMYWVLNFYGPLAARAEALQLEGHPEQISIAWDGTLAVHDQKFHAFLVGGANGTLKYPLEKMIKMPDGMAVRAISMPDGTPYGATKVTPSYNANNPQAGHVLWIELAPLDPASGTSQSGPAAMLNIYKPGNQNQPTDSLIFNGSFNENLVSYHNGHWIAFHDGELKGSRIHSSFLGDGWKTYFSGKINPSIKRVMISDNDWIILVDVPGEGTHLMTAKLDSAAANVTHADDFIVSPDWMKKDFAAIAMESKADGTMAIRLISSSMDFHKSLPVINNFSEIKKISNGYLLRTGSKWFFTAPDAVQPLRLVEVPLTENQKNDILGGDYRYSRVDILPDGKVIIQTQEDLRMSNGGMIFTPAEPSPDGAMQMRSSLALKHRADTSFLSFRLPGSAAVEIAAGKNPATNDHLMMQQLETAAQLIRELEPGTSMVKQAKYKQAAALVERALAVVEQEIQPPETEEAVLRDRNAGRLQFFDYERFVELLSEDDLLKIISNDAKAIALRIIAGAGNYKKADGSSASGYETVAQLLTSEKIDAQFTMDLFDWPMRVEIINACFRQAGILKADGSQKLSKEQLDFWFSSLWFSTSASDATAIKEIFRQVLGYDPEKLQDSSKLPQLLDLWYAKDLLQVSDSNKEIVTERNILEYAKRIRRVMGLRTDAPPFRVEYAASLTSTTTQVFFRWMSFQKPLFGLSGSDFQPNENYWKIDGQLMKAFGDKRYGGSKVYGLSRSVVSLFYDWTGLAWAAGLIIVFLRYAFRELRRIINYDFYPLQNAALKSADVILDNQKVFLGEEQDALRKSYNDWLTQKDPKLKAESLEAWFDLRSQKDFQGKLVMDLISALASRPAGKRWFFEYVSYLAPYVSVLRIGQQILGWIIWFVPGLASWNRLMPPEMQRKRWNKDIVKLAKKLNLNRFDSGWNAKQRDAAQGIQALAKAFPKAEPQKGAGQDSETNFTELKQALLAAPMEHLLLPSRADVLQADRSGALSLRRPASDGSEFNGPHRLDQPPVRLIDWKATARQPDHKPALVKTFVADAHEHVALVLDMSSIGDLPVDEWAAQAKKSFLSFGMTLQGNPLKIKPNKRHKLWEIVFLMPDGRVEKKTIGNRYGALQGNEILQMIEAHYDTARAANRQSPQFGFYGDSQNTDYAAFNANSALWSVGTVSESQAVTALLNTLAKSKALVLLSGFTAESKQALKKSYSGELAYFDAASPGVSRRSEMRKAERLPKDESLAAVDELIDRERLASQAEGKVDLWTMGIVAATFFGSIPFLLYQFALKVEAADLLPINPELGYQPAIFEMVAPAIASTLVIVLLADSIQKRIHEIFSLNDYYQKNVAAAKNLPTGKMIARRVWERIAYAVIQITGFISVYAGIVVFFINQKYSVGSFALIFSGLTAIVGHFIAGRGPRVLIDSNNRREGPVIVLRSETRITKPDDATDQIGLEIPAAVMSNFGLKKGRTFYTSSKSLKSYRAAIDKIIAGKLKGLSPAARKIFQAEFSDKIFNDDKLRTNFDLIAKGPTGDIEITDLKEPISPNIFKLILVIRSEVRTGDAMEVHSHPLLQTVEHGFQQFSDLMNQVGTKLFQLMNLRSQSLVAQPGTVIMYLSLGAIVGSFFAVLAFSSGMLSFILFAAGVFIASVFVAANRPIVSRRLNDNKSGGPGEPVILSVVPPQSRLSAVPIIAGKPRTEIVTVALTPIERSKVQFDLIMRQLTEGTITKLEALGSFEKLLKKAISSEDKTKIRYTMIRLRIAFGQQRPSQTKTASKKPEASKISAQMLKEIKSILPNISFQNFFELFESMPPQSLTPVDIVIAIAFGFMRAGEINMDQVTRLALLIQTRMKTSQVDTSVVSRMLADFFPDMIVKAEGHLIQVMAVEDWTPERESILQMFLLLNPNVQLDVFLIGKPSEKIEEISAKFKVYRFINVNAARNNLSRRNGILKSATAMQQALLAAPAKMKFPSDARVQQVSEDYSVSKPGYFLAAVHAKIHAAQNIYAGELIAAVTADGINRTGNIWEITDGSLGLIVEIVKAYQAVIQVMKAA